ncbi:MAG: alanine--tRNA ligase [Verrucomicrobia bacterium]|nr:MAG: alanine--tRNA ligase [Verrucomicrobiota bacterium]
MTSAQIRQSFLDFFREKKHTIVPSSSLLPDAPNLLFTNAGMNPFVPIFLGQQKPPWKPPRVVDTQKCIRAGGKHNDLEDVGLDTYHHTFFEMLGNWSFGDYFKKEAIEWAWELLVERWKFPPQRLYATVYKPGAGEPSEFDQEAYDHWAHLFREADLDPKLHVLSSGKADNFWMMGDTGPCGPCSEVHVDLTPDGDTRGALVNKEDPRCIEIWNLVFIQFNANPDGTFTPLPQRHVDTGMGFERAVAIIQGTKNLTDFSGTISNYETDVFRPIFDELEKLSGKKYGSTLPTVGQALRLPGDAEGSRSGRPTTDHEQEKIDVAFRVIADHNRALSFAIADGIIPSNEGRGYVLRRILRRAVRYGRTLGFHEPFFFKLVDVVAMTMGDVFPEIRAKQTAIKQTIRREEQAFNRTLDRGIEIFQTAVFESPEHDRDTGVITNVGSPTQPEFIPAREGQRLTGKFAFKLYDTYGFPLDLTELMARERGLTVDVAGFDKLMEQQRERARKAQKKEEISVEEDELKTTSTKFLGYDFLEAEVVVKTVLPGKNDELNIVVDRTPLYAEMGGQVGDQGLLHVPGHDWTEVGQLRVIDTQKRGEVFVHRAELVKGRAPEPGEAVRISVDADRRKLIQGHHTVTHLLHWALHEVVSRDASQKGSYVGPEKLTFDFSSAPLTRQERRDVEKLVNEKIAENAPVSWTEISFADAKQRKDIIQFFGEKYGDTVRVLQIGGAPRALNGYSMELCGGTHVSSTGEIGPFRIVKEEAIAAGTRRIEAVAGDAARAWANQEAVRQQEKFETLARKKPDIAALPAFDDDAATAEMLQQIDARAAHLEKVDADVREWEKKTAKSAEAELKSRAAQIANELARTHAGKNFCVAEVPDADGKLLQAIAETLKTKIKGPIFLVGEKDGNVALIAAVPKELISKFQANKLIQQIAPIVGGKGGGRPESAQGAGKDTSKVSEALTKARELLS